MTKRQWSIVAVLFFLNAFIFVTLFLLLRQVFLTPPEVAVATSTPTKTPIFTPLPTDTPISPLTPTPTNTLVVPTATPRPTVTPTFTPAPPTPTSLPPTATPVPSTPTNTPTFTPIPTPTLSFDYRVGRGPDYKPNCGYTFLEGTIWNADSTVAAKGIRVKVWNPWGWEVIETTGKDPAKATGAYTVVFDNKPKAGSWFVAVVDGASNLISPTVAFETTAAPCAPESEGKQWVTVDFQRNY
ncbi:MAG: hypothetical protein ACE5II_04060 [Anaerolineae bacterium]